MDRRLTPREWEAKVSEMSPAEQEGNFRAMREMEPELEEAHLDYLKSFGPIAGWSLLAAVSLVLIMLLAGLSLGTGLFVGGGFFVLAMIATVCLTARYFAMESITISNFRGELAALKRQRGILSQQSSSTGNSQR